MKKKERSMHCPLCGGLLVLVPRKSPPEIDWNSDANSINQSIESWKSFDEDQHEEYECVGKGCFRKDYPLYYHHPFRGPYSAPGDSWSLSWVK